MTNRRRNLLILFFVLGLVIALAARDREPRQTKLGLDLQGGTELVYQGRPTPQNPEIDGTVLHGPLDRDHSRSRCPTPSASRSRSSRASAPDQLRAGIPGEDDVEQATLFSPVGTTAKLQFYDWQPNLLGPERAIGGHPGPAAARRGR